MGLNLTRKYSINFSLPKRSKKQIKFLIIHYTGMIKEEKAIKRLCDPKAKVSSHYFIRDKGSIINFILRISYQSFNFHFYISLLG